MQYGNSLAQREAGKFFRKSTLLATTALITLSAVAAPRPAQAVFFTWLGSTADYNNPTNWSPAAVPGATDSANFNSSGTSFTVNVTAPSSAGSWAFSNPFNVSNAYTVNGSGISLSAAGLQSSTNVTVNNVISGAGGVSVNGGTLTLAALNTYTGLTSVNSGTLAVTGALLDSSANVAVNANGTFTGTGSIGGNVTVNGLFAPGSGTAGSSMTGLANFLVGPTGTYRVFINPTVASSATFNGTANLSGTLNAQFAAGSYVANSYTLLTANGGITGTFGSFTTTNLPAGFAVEVQYSPTIVILNLTALLAISGNFSDNQQNAADAINKFFNNGGTLPPEFADLFNLTGDALAKALTKRTGEVGTGAAQSSFLLMNMFLGLMLDPYVNGRGTTPGGVGLGFAPDQPTILPPEAARAYAAAMKGSAAPPAYDPRYSVWGTAFGGANNRDGDPTGVGSHDISARVGGFAAGVDYRIGSNTVIGAALAGGATNWSLSDDLGHGKGDAFQAGLYGVTRSGPAYLAGAFGYTHYWMSTDRNVAGNNLSADFDANNFGGRIEAGYRLDAPWMAVTPYVAGQVQSFHTPSYSEKGGGSSLDVDARTSTATRAELGARFDNMWMLADGSTLSWKARAAWAHDWTSDPSLTAAFQALPGTSFLVTGAEPAKNSALLSIGPEWRSPSGLSLAAKFDAELAGHSATYAGTGTLRYTW